MEFFDTLRYGAAWIVLITFPPAVAFWFLAHPLAEVWRRLEAWQTYSLLLGCLAVLGYSIYQVSGPLLAADLGSHPWLVVPALGFYAVAALLEVQCRRHLTLRTLVGVPELTQDPGAQKLLQSGIYGRVRHPRYLSLIFGVIALALFANYFFVYLFVPLFLVAIYIVTVLEEAELLRRFGAEYSDYQRRVPRLLPRWKSTAGPS